MSQGCKNPNSRRSQWATFFSAFGRNSSGSSLIEFAIVAAPLLVLMFLILEVGLVYLANGELENAVAQGARMIRTGEAQSQNFDAGKFKTQVCQYLTALLDCAHLTLDVRTFSSFGSTNLTNPLDGAGNLKSGFSYQPGVGGQIVIVRAFYEWDLPAKLPKAINGMQVSLSNMADGNLLLIATQAFRNEPFN